MSFKRILTDTFASPEFNTNNNIEVNLENPPTKNTQGDDIDDIERTALFIVYFIIFVLVLFICGFMYNLIKCYLPKWLNKNKKGNEQHHNSTGMKNVPYNIEHTIDDNVV